MAKPRVFADFHNAGAQGRLGLNCVGTVEDLSRKKISLADGLALTLYSEELEADATVRCSNEENLWVAEIDWDAIGRGEPIVDELEEQTGSTRHDVILSLSSTA